MLIDESSYNFPTNMKVRFMCDASGNRDDVYIDEVRVLAQWSDGDSRFDGHGGRRVAVPSFLTGPPGR